MWVRRIHLYLGLFLLPWAILYGITAFLFNHPTAFSDLPITNYSADTIHGTPLETRPTATQQAEALVATWNENQKPASPYRLVGEAKYGRDAAFATVKCEGQMLNILVDVKHGHGTIRSTPVVEKPATAMAPFMPSIGARKESRSEAKPINSCPIRERFQASIPEILARTNFPMGEIKVTSVPDVVFNVEADGQTWTASHNAMTGSLTAKPAEAEGTAISTRRFLLRLHTAHGYPGEPNARWWWAIIVDAMAFTLVFWGLSGLIMWWQIKSTRLPGLIVLVLSGITASGLGYAMHLALTAS
jgi:hypothetical protein